MKVFLTGGAGYIGSCCAEYLLDHGHQVTIFDSLITGHREAVDERAKFIEGSLSDKELLIDILSNEKFDVIMHFAAFSLVGESMTRPDKYFRNNNAYGLNLLDAAVRGKVKKIVFSSTAAIFGIPKDIPIKEDATKKPINPYGESKLIFEKMLKWYNKIYGLNYVSLRYFNAAGASQKFGEDHNPETHLIPIVLQVALGHGDKIMIFGNDYPTKDGTCIRDYIHILDLAQAHMLAMEKDINGSFNLGNGCGYSVKEVIDVAKEVTKVDIPTEIAARRPGDPAILIADSTLAKSKLKWSPKFAELEDIIESAWRWYKKYPKGYDK